MPTVLSIGPNMRIISQSSNLSKEVRNLLWVGKGGRRVAHSSLILYQGSELLFALQLLRKCHCKDPRDKSLRCKWTCEVRELQLPLPGELLLTKDSGVGIHASCGMANRYNGVFRSASLRPGVVNIYNNAVLGSGLEHQSGSDLLPPIVTKANFTPELLEIRQTLKRVLHLMSPLNYPLKCVLRVRGRLLGNIWTEQTIFRPIEYPDNRESHRYGNPSGEHYWAPVTNRIYNWPYHWLLKPSLNPATQMCQEKGFFWQGFQQHLLNRGAHSKAEIVSPADVPPAFGGYCNNCVIADLAHYSYITRAGQPTRSKCICSIRRQIQFEELREIEQSIHHFPDALDEFMYQLNTHGQDRQVFGTEFSLGLGPPHLAEGDQVWLLDGAPSPFILRFRNGNFRLIGECYLQAATRDYDTCVICKCKKMRKRIKRTGISIPDREEVTKPLLEWNGEGPAAKDQEDIYEQWDVIEIA